MQTPIRATRTPRRIFLPLGLALAIASGCQNPAVISESYNASEFAPDVSQELLKPGQTARAPIADQKSLSAEGVIYSLPRSLLKITFPSGDKPATLDVVQLPDLSHRYVLSGTHSAWANDKAVFKVSNGLLQSIGSTPESRVPTIAQTVLTAVSDARKLLELRKEVSDAKQPQILMIDPFDPQPGYGVTIDPTLDPGLKGRIDVKKPRGCPSMADGKNGRGFICVPVMTVVGVTVVTNSKLYEFRALVADPYLTYAIPMGRTACAKRETTVKLADGIVSEFEATRPSEVEACLSIPLNVVKAIIAAPFDAITGRTARLNAEKDLAKAQLELIKAQAALLESQKSNQTQ